MDGREKLWTPSFVLVTVANFVSAVAYYVIAMKIVEFTHEAHGVAYGAAGATVTIYAAASMATRLALGGKMDAWGLRRSALAGGCLSQARFF